MNNKILLNSARIYSEIYNIFPKSKENKFRILTYHSIGNDVPLDKKGIYNLSKDKFIEQMKLLHCNNIMVSTLDDFCNLSITFDDGFLNNYTVALPILEKYKFPFTIFITPKFIKNNLNNLYLNKIQLRDLASNKLATIGAHGFTHNHLGLMNREESFNEICDSKKWLEDIIGKEIIHFSYPFGSYNDETISLLKENNYKTSCTVNFGINCNNQNKFELKRTDIFSFDTLRDFNLKINGGWDWLEFRTKRHKKK